MFEEEYKQNKSMIVPDVESPPKTVNLHKPKFTTRRFYPPLPTLKSQEKADIKPKVFDENVLVLPHPPLEHQQIYNKKGLPVVDVCVDAFLTRQLRHHQKEGIIFMYKSILGFQHEYGHGAILADEMGLGKTLQCIALIWTLSKQGPYGGLPVLKRVIIITPCSLVNNWKNEFHKWLGKSRLQIFAIDKKHTVKEYSESPKSILIISYEMFLRSAKLLSSINFDLVVCDEGHRIKNLNIKISNVVNCLSTTRRILLTGTPIQNDLAEFFSIVDFVNPGTLGSIQCFRRTFEKPIVLSRNPECTEQEKEYGEERREELSKIANTFMLRRTHDVIHKYLPPKSETVVFCRPTNLQKNLYKHFLQSRDIEAILSENIQVDPSMHLVYISILRKLCNHPLLVYQADNMHSDISNISVLDYMKSAFPFGYNPSIQDSGKMRVLEKMLTALFSQKKRKEKIVIVSCFTQTLNIIEDMCKKKNYDILRLDGSTSASTRQEIVDIFNLSYTKFKSKHYQFLH
ncbi:DNA repair and recombination protein RAD54B-like [Stegodyphus dumicola]|uniref:DNA repair and recombination protein RAD54B-like n=1 Tax=Stegodyphus dumicola TaxID=202533 RepID=UPI0015B1F783|nr:DNA repair and recombination protein RAD54B-like [Stegodyphus dumicola]